MSVYEPGVGAVAQCGRSSDVADDVINICVVLNARKGQLSLLARELKTREWKSQDRTAGLAKRRLENAASNCRTGKRRDRTAGLESAGLESAGLENAGLEKTRTASFSMLGRSPLLATQSMRASMNVSELE